MSPRLFLAVSYRARRCAKLAHDAPISSTSSCARWRLGGIKDKPSRASVAAGLLNLSLRARHLKQ